MVNNNILSKNIKSIALWLIIGILAIIYIYNYNQIYNVGYEINYTFDGIKCQANNIDSEIPTKIIINGVYKKDLATKDYVFKGDIILDGELCYASNSQSKKYVFNDYNMSSIENDSFKGEFFIGHMMNEITIIISVPKQDGDRTFSFEDGWLISAPCKTRSEAIAISNKLINSLYKINLSFSPHFKSLISMTQNNDSIKFESLLFFGGRTII